MIRRKDRRAERCRGEAGEMGTKRNYGGERGELTLKVSLIRWNVCPLPQIPLCGARKKRPKLMSLGRTICLSGLLLRDKKLVFASVPIACPWLWKKRRQMKGGAEDFWRIPLYADAMNRTSSGRWNLWAAFWDRSQITTRENKRGGRMPTV